MQTQRPDAKSKASAESPNPTARPRAGKKVVSIDAIAVRAYEKFMNRGAEPGHDQEDWLAAEKELAEEWSS